jgi:3-deoxy-7-phosphoheptulonate synthase
MLVVMRPGATPAEIKAVADRIRSLGFVPHAISGAVTTAIGLTGNANAVDPALFEEMAGVAEAIQVTHPWKLVGREVGRPDSKVEVGGVTIGGPEVVVVAGPCAVESLEQTMAVARAVKAAGAQLLRGGAYKPRTSPYSFQGLGEEGLEILARVRAEVGLPVVTEAVDERSCDLVERHGDMIQIGARNMQNFSLLKRAGRARKPVLLKRGMSATVEELLMAAEYIAAEGNPDIVLCERGVRTFSNHARNTLDLSVIPAVKRMCHLPILVDPSHGTGRRHKVIPLARAAIAVGADGVMIEVHSEPDRALSDGPQALYPDQFATLMDELRSLAPIVHRTLSRPAPVSTQHAAAMRR